MPNDPYASTASQWHLDRVGADAAWDYTIGTSNILVAVLDSGINPAHPDLAGQAVPGYDFVNNDTNPADDYGHGTAVAGTIVASGNNGIGVAGVAFGIRVLPVKIMDASGYASYSCIAEGIRYAVDNKARVINISLAGSSYSRTLQEAINYAWSSNVVVVAAAGNHADAIPEYPAACDHVVGVSATDIGDNLATFSCYGSHIALSAPGDGIWTTQNTAGSPYGSWRGTSFASPIVAGVSALVISIHPTLNGAQLVSILESTADDLGSTGPDDFFGHGRVNAFRAVVAAANMMDPPPAQDPDPDPPAPDKLAPTIIVTQAPAEGARLTSAWTTVSGIASDETRLSRVEVQVNDEPPQIATGTETWSAQVKLSAGLNQIKARSIDAANNASLEQTRHCTLVVQLPVTIETNGVGKVIPNLDGRALEIGREYRLKAVPGRDQVFAGWSGPGIASDSATLLFTMRSNLVIRARFVPTPFPVVQGTYSGLIANSNAVLPANSGAFTLTVTRMGRFTGKIGLEGKSHGFTGQLSLTGESRINIIRRDKAALDLELHVNLSNPNDRVNGAISDGLWASQLSGDRNVFRSGINPAPQAGSYAFVLQEQDVPENTAATGSSRISMSGRTRVKGRLQGRAFSASTSIARNGDCPLYLSMSKGSEVVIGWLNFPETAQFTASGTVLWVRTGTNAFATTLKAAAMR